LKFVLKKQTPFRTMASDTRSTLDKGGKVREKVQLQPGFHLMDWMRLMNMSSGTTTMKKITLQELACHNTQFDCWTAYNGKVYNISQYINYHPGGIPKLMLGAGKDCTTLFNKYHRWVNIDSMLAKCVVGILLDDDMTIIEDDGEGPDSAEKDNDLNTIDKKISALSILEEVEDEKIDEIDQIALKGTKN